MNHATLEQAIGHTFADGALLDLAMTHPSYALAHKCRDNQRLEFLGDAVLEICVSRVLYERFPKLREGQLTRRRAALVCEANLARAARQLGLGAFLKLDRGEELVGGRENPSILADTMEAVIAAVYLDAGMDKAAALIDRVMGDYESSVRADRDAKSALQEYLQALGEETPTYEIIGEDGPPHARVFTARVLRADGTQLGVGRGARKQRAEEAAAQMAMASLKPEA
ncbi:MAG: ribonuclease III [Clostridia bacterium]|nr:ribonuclease III [Clostridia bacterium]